MNDKPLETAHRLIEALQRRLYETLRQLPERNFAKGHSYEEWVEHEKRAR